MIGKKRVDDFFSQCVPAQVPSLVGPELPMESAGQVVSFPPEKPGGTIAEPAGMVISIPPANTGKKRKRTDLPPDKIKEIAEYAKRNPEATNKDLAERFGLSDEPFRKGKPLRLAVDLARTGDLGRYAAKPEKLFNDEN